MTTFIIKNYYNLHYQITTLFINALTANNKKLT